MPDKPKGPMLAIEIGPERKSDAASASPARRMLDAIKADDEGALEAALEEWYAGGDDAEDTEEE